jgi:hypothetical protein
MKNLKRKPLQIYIESKQNNVLEMVSKKTGFSKAEIIRKSLDKFLKELPAEEDPAIGLIGLGSSGKRHLSDKHDRYLAKYAASKR